MNIGKMYECEREIIDDIDDIMDFECFIGTLVDDWLDDHGYKFEDGDKILKRLVILRNEVRDLLKEEDKWYM